MFLANVKVLLFLAFVSGCLSQEGHVLIQIPDGLVRGRIEITITNTTFFSFQGIPFAAPPVGELRFQAPQPVQPWDDILDATYEKNICYQVTNDYDNESEDCLFINVFVPALPLSSNGPLPVMFFIYGGGFVEGSSESVNYGPQHFMEYDVIIITSNYRVGPFGFASTGDDSIPGNAGLKDQNFALQWVQKNIQYFGGDPEKVTIFGESAGAASVAYQILSPTSEGLFRAAIGESGSALSAWAYQRNQVEITYQTAGYIDPAFNDPNVTSSDLLDFLLNVTAREIDAASHTVSLLDGQGYYQIQQGFFYAPVIEHEHEGAFITKLQYESLGTGEFNKVPLIIGFNSEESLFYASDEAGLNYMAQAFDNAHSLLIPLDLHVEDEEATDETAEEIKELYVADGTFAEDPLNLVKYASDQSFIRSVIKHAQLQSQYTDVYLYRFAYHGVLGGNTNEPVEGFSDSVRHGEELGYLFRRNYGGYNTTDLSTYPESDVAVFRRFITLFTNFAKYLNPTPEESELLENIIWPTVNVVDVPYLDIGSYSLVKTHPRNETYEQWEGIYQEHGIPPYDTY